MLTLPLSPSLTLPNPSRARDSLGLGLPNHNANENMKPFPPEGEPLLGARGGSWSDVQADEKKTC